MNQIQQVFWLSDRPSDYAFPAGWPRQWLACRRVAEIPDYSGGTATEFHRVPGYWMSPGYGGVAHAVKLPSTDRLRRQSEKGHCHLWTTARSENVRSNEALDLSVGPDQD